MTPTYYVKDMDQQMTRYNTYDSVHDMPENWQLAVMLLDAGADHNGLAQIDYLGVRHTFKGDAYYTMTKRWRRVVVHWSFDSFSTAVSQEEGPAQVGTLGQKDMKIQPFNSGARNRKALIINMRNKPWP